jgi:hypothetical protein
LDASEDLPASAAFKANDIIAMNRAPESWNLG